MRRQGRLRRRNSLPQRRNLWRQSRRRARRRAAATPIPRCAAVLLTSGHSACFSSTTCKPLSLFPSTSYNRSASSPWWQSGWCPKRKSRRINASLTLFIPHPIVPYPVPSIPYPHPRRFPVSRFPSPVSRILISEYPVSRACIPYPTRSPLSGAIRISFHLLPTLPSRLT